MTASGDDTCRGTHQHPGGRRSRPASSTACGLAARQSPVLIRRAPSRQSRTGAPQRRHRLRASGVAATAAHAATSSAAPARPAPRVAGRPAEQQRQTIEQAAATLNTPPARIRALVDQERDRRELEKYRLDNIPVTRAREFLEHELAREPGLTRAEVAHRMGIHRADFDRAFGYAPAKHGAMQTRVGIATASRALGRAPYELEGC